ncbi:MAG: putative coiled-coil protein SlyX [Pseudohongiellaceae bacterium]|jgi:uncharacterized coiled-coil protein SlyX
MSDSANNQTNKLLQQQIDDLQSRLSHHEDLLQALDAVIISQDKAIIVLQQKLIQNQDKLDDVAHSLELSSNEKPPHY